MTGTNGKTTTVRMLGAMPRAAGHAPRPPATSGTPLVEAVLAEPAYDVIAVELSSFQLHWSHSLRPLAAVCSNVAPDHVDWHGSLDAYAADKGRVYASTEVACVYNVRTTERRAAGRAPLQEAAGHRLTLGSPGTRRECSASSTTCLVDRAFSSSGRLAAELDTSMSRVARTSLAPHLVATPSPRPLATAYGVPPVPCAPGCGPSARAPPDRPGRPTPDGRHRRRRQQGDEPACRRAPASRRTTSRGVDRRWPDKGADFDDLVAGRRPAAGRGADRP